MTKIPECLSDLAVEELFKEDMRDYLLDDGVIDDAEKADLLAKYVDGLSYQGGEIDTPEEIDEKIVFYQNQHDIFIEQVKTNLNPSTQLNIFANQSLYSRNDTYFVAQINAKAQRDIGYRSSSSTDNEQLVDFNPKILKRTITSPKGFLDFTKMESPFYHFQDETKLKEFVKEMGLLLKEAQQKTGSLLSLFHNVKLNGDWLRFFVKQLAKFQESPWFHDYFGPDPANNFKGVNLSGQDLSMNERTFANIDLSYADLTGANLAGVNLSYANLAGANLAGVNFSYAQLSGVNLTGADLTGVNFSYAQLSDLFFIGRHLTDDDLHQASFNDGHCADLPNEGFKEIDFSYAVFDNVVLSGLNLDGINFTGAKFQKVELKGVHLENAILVGADLRDASLQYVNLQDAKLMGADLRNVWLEYVDLSGANLTGANLSGADLRNIVNLSGTNKNINNIVNFTGAKLNGAKLVGANLQAGFFHMAELMGADLSGAKLPGVDLSGAKLMSAVLVGANLTGANLQNADFTDAWLKDADLTNAKNADLIGADFIRLDCSPDSLLEAYFPPTHFFDFDPNAILGPDSDD